MKRWMSLAAAAAASLTLAAAAHAVGTVGNNFPAGFPAIEDASLGKPVIGFGAAGPVSRTPVIFLHGNNDTPFPTGCNPFGRMQALAQHLADNGYATSELWGLGYQGDQCDLGTVGQTRRSSIAHTNAANVPDLRRFVAIDGPNLGIINCSPNAANYWQLAALGGFTPSSEVCQELGSPNTPFLKLLNGSRGDDDGDEEHAKGGRSTRTLVIRNADTSFVFFALQDGVIAPVPAEDSFGQPTDFSRSAEIKGAEQLDLVGQGTHDPILGTTHLGILNSPQTRQAVLEFLTKRTKHH